jgi:hypothetical protein
MSQHVFGVAVFKTPGQGITSHLPIFNTLHRISVAVLFSGLNCPLLSVIDLRLSNMFLTNKLLAQRLMLLLVHIISLWAP